MKKWLVVFLALILLFSIGVETTVVLAAEAKGEGEVVETVQDADGSSALRIFASAFLALFGAINLVAPKKLWEMGMTRRAKEMKREPTQAELNGNRLTGVIFLFLAVMLFLGRIK